MLVDGNNYIRHCIKENKLFAAGKIGVTELKIIEPYSRGEAAPYEALLEGFVNSGIFPISRDVGIYFNQVYTESIKSLDIAPEWCGIPQLRKYEEVLLKDSYTIRMRDLEPYYYDKPWTDSLEGKDVLVISPFAKTIEQQFKKLDSIWSGKIKNNFNLKTYKFEHSTGIAGNNTQDETYKDRLERSINDIKDFKFDLAIIGAGAYALPLCSYIKNTMKKSAIHLGGATQILFGIKGHRWDTHDVISGFYNEHWVRPSKDETPDKAKINEEGCYW